MPVRAGRALQDVNFFFGSLFFFYYICTSYNKYPIFNFLAFAFMYNSLFFNCFLTFLDEEKLLYKYLKSRFSDSSFNLDHFGSFFKGDPSDWISDAFLWREHSSVNWFSVNERWMSRLDLIYKNLQSIK